MNNLENIHNLCIGIDFGTTNSCLSVWYNNKAIIIPDIDGNEIIPTIIEINSDKKIIGKEAYLRKEIFENNETKKSIFLIYEIKKLLGKKFSELNKNNIALIAFDLGHDEDDNILILDVEKNKSYYPEEIATHLFMSFKLKAEEFLSKKFNKSILIKNSVISVPAYFNKNQRQIIKNSAEYAGLNVIRLLNEPTAAAICYGLGKTNNNGINIIVFDFGGGTLDVSLLNINDGVYEVLASCGNNNLGGSDFDNKIMEYCIQQFLETNNISYDTFIENISENSLQKLKLLSEQSKISLTDNNNSKIKINNFYLELNLNINLSRDKFNEICNDLIRLILKPVIEVIELSELDKSDITEIIMVGGMTRIPIIRYNIEKFFNKDVNSSINPDNVVAIGASIHGFMLLNNKDIEDKLLLIDRTSLSIGVETSGGIMDVIIPRGNIIPIKKTKKYSTDTDYVEYINIKIFEGERKFTKDNFLIGDFILSGIEKQKRGIPEILITFLIDSDGIIKIKAEDLDNPLNKKTIQISGNKNNLSEEQINKIIENANIMNQIDKIDKMKKESYLSLIDSSSKILENLNSNNIKIDIELKNDIINNINEILKWLKNTDYSEIEVDKYKELLHDFKINYSIYIMHQSTPIIELDASNLLNEEEKGIEIYDNDNNSEKYEEQINYFRTIINDYDNYKKQIKIIQLMDKSNHSLIPDIEKLFDDVYNFASDNILNFFINKDLTDFYVDDICIKLNELDFIFKDKFDIINNEFNIVNKLINNIKNKEDILLNKLEILENSEDINDDIYNNKMSIRNKLDLIIEFEGIIYKMNSGYSNTEIDKFQEIINILDNM